MTDAPRGGVPTPITDVTTFAARAAQQAAGRADEVLAYVSGKRRTAIDWLLVAICWLSLGVNAWLLIWLPRNDALRHGLWDTDLVLSGLMAIAIAWRWLRFRIGRRYLRKHWWEVPALFPFVVPVVGQWQWVLLVVLVARFARVVDRTDNVFGDKVTVALFTHFTDPIVDTIKRPITIAVLDEVIDVIKTGTYAANIKAALDENHDELEAMVLDLVRQDPTTGKLRYLPFHDDIVQLVSTTVLRLVDGALADPRTTELISDIIRNSASQVRTAVRSAP